jgi:dTDP-4-amino-4,6-dideoxygalactose transaminase
MHYAGYPCRMPQIMALAEKHNLDVIEDAAHAPGAALNGRALGAFGAVGCYSFFSNKNLPTGEGGMLVTDRDDLAEKLRLLRSHGMTSLTYDRHQGHAFSYDVVALGYNHRIDEIRSALGLAQLAKLADNNAQRRKWTHAYWDALADLPVDLPFKAADQGTSAYHIFPMLLPEGTDRQAFMTGLRDAGVQSSIHYRPVHTFSYYVQRYGKQSLPVTEAAAAREVTLPLYPTMGEAGVEVVVEAVKESL